ncbi:SHOCT domain-containing protein [Kosmotoga pacifica]|uniref:SHOCT domain-containing protein n=1 Tax=Kosmotoga pacifica TaxID=1330330 RepID=A0A0G2Z6Z0_9BACT|nr:SHOCT domain-containing protein [Kosmotoga pacifica]AKI97327.1 hypothetical protein IX53_05280 [Kosmotoga pacifica]
MHWYWWGWPGFSAFGWLPMIIMLVVYVLVAVVVIYFLAKIFRAGHASSEYSRNSERNRALETLKERYARGEITDEEFNRMRKNLER